MLTAVIIDDNFRDTEILENLLKKFCSDDILITGKASNTEDAFLLILEKKPDVLFLDIELGTDTGFNLLARFGHHSFKVIFVTGYDKYAIQAIKLNALDYLLKPVEIDELVKAVQRLKQTENESVAAELKNLLHHIAHPHHKSNRIAIPVINGYTLAVVEDIVYCEASKEYTYIHCLNQPPVCSSINLGEYEDLLQGYAFCRVHHSFLVNKDHVKEYVKGEGGELLMQGDRNIPVSRRKKQEVIEWLKTNY